MLIKRIKARNFKTYLNLDLDISVDQDSPIILIGGVNGGGKNPVRIHLRCVIWFANTHSTTFQGVAKRRGIGQGR